jgi:hypothetical protein
MKMTRYYLGEIRLKEPCGSRKMEKSRERMSGNKEKLSWSQRGLTG